MFLGHPARSGYVPLDLAMSPPFEQKCWHPYSIREIVCSKRKSPNPEPLPLLKAFFPARSPGLCFPSYDSNLYLQGPVQEEKPRHSCFPTQGCFPLALKVLGLMLTCCGHWPSVLTAIVRERTVENPVHYIQAASEEGVAAETR